MTEYKQKELNQMLDRVDACLVKVSEMREEKDRLNYIIKVIDKELDDVQCENSTFRDESDMLKDENIKMATFLLKDGYTNDDVDNIAKGFPIDTGGE